MSSAIVKAPIKVRQNICPCDSAYCSCYYEATNLLTGENFKLTGYQLLDTQYQINWSEEEATRTSSMPVPSQR